MLKLFAWLVAGIMLLVDAVLGERDKNDAQECSEEVAEFDGWSCKEQCWSELPGDLKILSIEHERGHTYRITTESPKYGKVTQSVLLPDAETAKGGE